MAVALRNKLATRKEEVLEYTKRYGQGQAMTRYDVTPIAFHKLMSRWTGDENYGSNPQINMESPKGVGDQLVEAILRKIYKLENDNQRLKEKLQIMQFQLRGEHRKERIDEEIDHILKACGNV
jgi:hypothetical protein